MAIEGAGLGEGACCGGRLVGKEDAMLAGLADRLGVDVESFDPTKEMSPGEGMGAAVEAGTMGIVEPAGVVLTP